MTWKILRITETPRLDQGTLTFKTDRLVQYMVGDHGPFQLTIPGDQFTSERVRVLLDAEAAKITALFPQG